MKHSSSQSSMEFRANGSCSGQMQQRHDPYRGDKKDLAELEKSLASCLSHTEKLSYEPEDFLKKSY